MSGGKATTSVVLRGVRRRVSPEDYERVKTIAGVLYGMTWTDIGAREAATWALDRAIDIVAGAKLAVSR